MEVSKFKIGENLIDIKDAQARDDVVAAMNAAQDAQSTADLKLNSSDAWKIATISVTEENVTIASLASHTFSVDIPAGISSVIVLNARSSDSTRTLTPINLYASPTKMNAVMSNQSSVSMNATMTITFTYAYK